MKKDGGTMKAFSKLEIRHKWLRMRKMEHQVMKMAKEALLLTWLLRPRDPLEESKQKSRGRRMEMTT